MSDNPLRNASLEVIVGLQHVIQVSELLPSDNVETSADNLKWMCVTLVENINTFPVDKISRWIGFVQGVLACQGLLNVTEERDRTRPLFHAAYQAMEIVPPASMNMPS